MRCVALEEQRLKIEQGLEPLRVRIGDLKLKEQAAALNTEQFASNWSRPAPTRLHCRNESGRHGQGAGLQGEITRLNNAIAELGAVNLAALQELETATERKGYLDMQAADLTEAMETLENAIRRSTAKPAICCKHLRHGQRPFRAIVPGAVRAVAGRTGDDRRGNPRCRRAGHRPAAGQEEFDHPPAFRRRKGADRHCAGFRCSSSTRRRSACSTRSMRR